MASGTGGLWRADPSGGSQKSARSVFPSAARATLIDPMTALWLILGVLVGAGIVLLALRPRLRALAGEAARAAELDREPGPGAGRSRA